MKHQNRAFQLSLLIHAVIVTAIFGTNALLHGPNRRIIMNFDLARPNDKPAGIREQRLRQGNHERTRLSESQAKPAPERAPESTARPDEEKKIVTEPQPYLPPAPLPASSSAVEVVTGGGDVKMDQSPTGSSLQKAGGAVGGPDSDYVTGSHAGGGSHGHGEGLDSRGRTRYLAEHYSYIRDRILRNISYPETARRMSWEGKVIVSFIVTDEGNVEAIKILQSTGFKVLDNDAIEAIISAAPYPKPPVAAQVIIPIVYHLH